MRLEISEKKERILRELKDNPNAIEFVNGYFYLVSDYWQIPRTMLYELVRDGHLIAEKGRKYTLPKL